MDELRKGYTLWARKTVKSEIFLSKPDKWFKIWFYVVSRVNWENVDKFDRGSCHLSNAEIAIKTGASLDQVKKALAFMRSQSMISTRRSTRGYLIKVLNYAKYQDVATYKSTRVGTTKAPEKHQRSTTIVETEKHKTEQQASPTAPLTQTVSDEQPEPSEKAASPGNNTAPRPDVAVVEAYMDIQGFLPTQRKPAFGRNLPAAKRLLQAVGGDKDAAISAMEECKRWSGTRTWTLETVLNHLHRFMELS